VRILLAHKFFRHFGGVERHLFALRSLLQNRGHEVVDFGMADPHNLPSPYAGDFVSRVDFRHFPSRRERLRALGRMLYSFEARRRIGRLVDRTRPDVAHLLSFYHHLSPSILSVLRRRGIPIVHKLADYKVVCPVYTLFAHGAPCERCAGGRVYRVATRRCAGGRLDASLALALEAVLHRWVLRSYSLVDLFLAPSRFLAAKVREMGLRGTVRVVPNFVELDGWRPFPLPAAPVLAYAGRLAPEKGVRQLVRAMEGVPALLRIFGDGAERPALERIVRERGLRNVEILGHVEEADLRAALVDVRAIVLPALWYENNPHAILEAFALGRPAIASDIGGLPELVRHGETGLLVPPGDIRALRDAMRVFCDDHALVARLGRAARGLVEAEHAPDVFYTRLLAAYREVGR
jgi:glycosyltransferase involved in cell wall biosynthesis